MGLDNINCYFIKEDLSENKEIFFLGYPSLILDGEYSKIFKLNKYFWSSCDLSKIHPNNFNEDFLHLNIHNKYDLIIDHGSLQHIFNPIKGLEKIFQISKSGAIVHHNLPYNNFPGFGYYQFSPELFVELEKFNLIENLELFLTDEHNKKYFFKVNSNLLNFRFNFGKLLRLHVRYKIINDPKNDITKLINAKIYQKDLFNEEMQEVIQVKNNLFKKVRNSLIIILLIEFFSNLYYLIFKLPPPFRKNNKNLEPSKYVSYKKNKQLN